MTCTDTRGSGCTVETVAALPRCRLDENCKPHVSSRQDQSIAESPLPSYSPLCTPSETNRLLIVVNASRAATIRWCRSRDLRDRTFKDGKTVAFFDQSINREDRRRDPPRLSPQVRSRTSPRHS